MERGQGARSERRSCRPRGDSVGVIICSTPCTHDLIFCFCHLRVSFRRKSKKDKEGKEAKDDHKAKEAPKGKKDKEEVRSNTHTIIACQLALPSIFRRSSLMCPTWLHTFSYSIPFLRDFLHDFNRFQRLMAKTATINSLDAHGNEPPALAPGNRIGQQ